MPRSPLAVLLLVTLPACGGGGGGGGDEAEGPARVVAMSATDALRFEPSTVTAKAGEKVTFRVTNTGKATHEFVIGDDDYHAVHSVAMGTGSPSAHAGHDENGASVDVPPGATAELTFTMPDKAPRFACYVDRHSDAGMKGAVTYG